MSTVMLTGAAGNLGRAVASAFAETGANLVLLDLKRGNLQDSERQLFIATDLLDAGSVQAAVDMAVEAGTTTVVGVMMTGDTEPFQQQKEHVCQVLLIHVRFGFPFLYKARFVFVF